MAYRPPQPGPSNTSQLSQPAIVHRSSGLPPVPQVSSNNLGQPGATSQTTQTQSNASNGSNTGEKGPDYVYFERKPGQFGEQTTGKAMAAKMKLELYYKEAVEGVVGRKERLK